MTKYICIPNELSVVPLKRKLFEWEDISSETGQNPNEFDKCKLLLLGLSFELRIQVVKSS